MRLIRSLLDNGVVLQVDAQSILGQFGFRTQQQCKTLLRGEMVELVCSDSHDIQKRPPELSQCFQLVKKKYGNDYAKDLFCNNGKKLLQTGASQEEFA